MQCNFTGAPGGSHRPLEVRAVGPIKHGMTLPGNLGWCSDPVISSYSPRNDEMGVVSFGTGIGQVTFHMHEIYKIYPYKTSSGGISGG